MSLLKKRSFAIVVFVIVVIVFNLLGDSLRDVLDPRDEF